MGREVLGSHVASLAEYTKISVSLVSTEADSLNMVNVEGLSCNRVGGTFHREPLAAGTVSAVIAVYPRVGGGTPGLLGMFQMKDAGLSPRGRGNLPCCKLGRVHGALVACVQRLTASIWSVYPRVGGGTCVIS